MLKSLSGKGVSTLHIATHGFYNEEPAGNVDLNKTLNGEDKALHRSGLLMAGAGNDVYDFDSPIDDGLLTAAEIAPLDFRGLDLVSLSACQTALGDISSDGVMGLQRGFKKAGAESILMSLYKVNDFATQLFMTEFYRSLTDGATKLQSLAAARRCLADYVDTDGNRPFNTPFHLNAFILLDALD